jgi:hypothetical protein
MKVTHLKKEDAIQVSEAIIREAMYSSVYNLKHDPEEILLRIHPKKKESYNAILEGNVIVKQNNQQIKIVDIILVLNELKSKKLIELNYSSIYNKPIHHFEEKIQVKGFDINGEPIIYRMKDGTIRIVFSELPKRDIETFDLDKFSKEFINAVNCRMIHDDREIFHIQNPNSNTVNVIKQFLNDYKK